jgi:hypothetical protein
MDAVGSRGQGDVSAIVNEDAGVRGGGYGTDDEGEEVAWGEVFFADLDVVYSGGGVAGDAVKQGFQGGIEGEPVSYVVSQHAALSAFICVHLWQK